MPLPDEGSSECEHLLTDPARVAEALEATLPAPAVERLASTFRALADPTRLRLLQALGRGELCVHDLAHLLGVTISAVSHQLRLLRELRIVRGRRDGQHVFYALDNDHVSQLLALATEHVSEQ